MLKVTSNNTPTYNLFNYDPTAAETRESWLANTLVKVGRLVYPQNGYLYEATTEGTTGATEPTWPTTIGSTVTDGTAVWTCIATVNGPVSVSATLDGSGGTVDSTIVTAYLTATRFNYTGVSLTPENEEQGVDWKISVDGGTTWLDTNTFTDIDATVSDVVSEVQFKAVVTNDGSVSTGTFTLATHALRYTEGP